MIPNYCTHCGKRFDGPRGTGFCQALVCQRSLYWAGVRKLADKLGMTDGDDFRTKEHLMYEIAGRRCARKTLTTTMRHQLNALECDLKRHPFEECKPFWDRFYAIVNGVRDIQIDAPPTPPSVIEDVADAFVERRLEIRHVFVATNSMLALHRYVTRDNTEQNHVETDVDLRARVIQKLREREG